MLTDLSSAPSPPFLKCVDSALISHFFAILDETTISIEGTASFVFTELANTMKYGGGFLYNLLFTELHHCVSQNRPTD